MKTAEHVERLLSQGKKPKKLLELDFPKRVVTRVRRKLREEKNQPIGKSAKSSRDVANSDEGIAVASHEAIEHWNQDWRLWILT